MPKTRCRTAFSTFLLVALALPSARAQATSPWGKRDNTYHFGKPKKEPAKKPLKTVPGRIHLLDGSSRSVPLAYVEYNQIVAVENGAETNYYPKDVSSFVMKQDSFVVLREFRVAIGEDEQGYSSAFVKVGAVGAGFTLYRFTGTMQREVRAYSYGTVQTGIGTIGVPGGSTSTENLMSKVWLLKLDGDSGWRSLSTSGPSLQHIIAPLIADDKKLSRSIDWEYVNCDEVQTILLKDLANKKAALN